MSLIILNRCLLTDRSTFTEALLRIANSDLSLLLGTSLSCSFFVFFLYLIEKCRRKQSFNFLLLWILFCGNITARVQSWQANHMFIYTEVCITRYDTPVLCDRMSCVRMVMCKWGCVSSLMC